MLDRGQAQETIAARSSGAAVPARAALQAVALVVREWR